MIKKELKIKTITKTIVVFRLKAFMDSLKHACKVPNTDQPFACVDMMVAGVILDKVHHFYFF